MLIPFLWMNLVPLANQVFPFETDKWPPITDPKNSRSCFNEPWGSSCVVPKTGHESYLDYGISVMNFNLDKFWCHLNEIQIGLYEVIQFKGPLTLSIHTKLFWRLHLMSWTKILPRCWWRNWNLFSLPIYSFFLSFDWPKPTQLKMQPTLLPKIACIYPGIINGQFDIYIYKCFKHNFLLLFDFELEFNPEHSAIRNRRLPLLRSFANLLHPKHLPNLSVCWNYRTIFILLWKKPLKRINSGQVVIDPCSIHE